jgi:hypothetical protein
MTAFATSDDLETLMGTTFTTDQTAQADLLLDLASTAIRSYCRQTIDLVADDDVKLEGTWKAELVLPERPVVSVSSVKINGIPVADGSWFWDDHQVVRRGSRVFSVNGPDLPGGLDFWAWSWGGPAWTVEVTYTHGFSDVPNDIRMVCLTAAQRTLSTPVDVRQETIGHYSVSYARSTGKGVILTDDERAVLRQGGYRKTWAGPALVA